jgi:hypothetical protein
MLAIKCITIICIVTDYWKYGYCTVQQTNVHIGTANFSYVSSTLPILIQRAVKKHEQPGPNFVMYLIGGRKRPSGSYSGWRCCTETVADRCGVGLPLSVIFRKSYSLLGHII